MKNSERKTKKKKSDTKKSYLISYYSEHSATFGDRMYHDIKNRIVEASSKKEAYQYFADNIMTNPSVINIICLDDD